MSKNNFDRPIGPKEAPRLSEYNFGIDASAIVSAIRYIKDTKWPRPLQSDLTQRDPNLMCKYHDIHGHRMEDCRQLREEVARLFNNGHLREFLNDRAKIHFRNMDSNKQTKPEEPQHVINMIIGGFDIPRGSMLKRTKLFITREKRTRDYLPEGTLSFNEKDEEGIAQPHNYALIEGRGITQPTRSDRTAVRVLNGFNMACETTKGEIKLPVNVTGTIKADKFYVIEGDMRYNALLGRPYINNMRAIPSTLH
uniref:Uncharacterized protein n=1 Tax=Nicotiana tabacum TaxID=4097 RepID=A0A1S4DPC2_TOBAC|nr:PREDICTED: uncharacterized protein LOC107831985 [Nicotiana tabacum]